VKCLVKLEGDTFSHITQESHFHGNKDGSKTVTVIGVLTTAWVNSIF